MKFRREVEEALLTILGQLNQIAKGTGRDGKGGGGYRGPWKKTLCIDFLKDKCTYGETKCRFTHDEDQKNTYATLSDSEKQTMVDDIGGKGTGSKGTYGQYSGFTYGKGNNYSTPYRTNTNQKVTTT